MRYHPLRVSLETIIAASPLLGHELEDRSTIREAQDDALADRFAFTSSVPLRSPRQRDLFLVAPLDLLVSREGGRNRFHLLELNGTGIGGLTNLTDRATCDVLTALAESARNLPRADGVVLVAVSGKESQTNPRRNRLMHEKLLFVEALRHGLARRHGGCDVATLATAPQAGETAVPRRPLVVLDYIKDLLAELSLDEYGTLWLRGRPVTAIVNDRFCENALQRFDHRVDLARLATFNRCFAAGSDKGVAYDLLNEFCRRQPDDLLAPVPYAHAYSRQELVELVRQWQSTGRQAVIKPHATGLGHGIEFFLDPREPQAAVEAKIDRSLAETAEYYAIRGGALPYTVCPYVDAQRVRAPGHPLDGHRFELRIVVYRDGMALRAFPSIAKVARERDGGHGCPRRALINNITASGDTAKVCGADYMLPLCHPRTWEMLGLSLEELEPLCAALTGYVAHILNQVEDQPRRLGLPPRERRRTARPALLAAA